MSRDRGAWGDASCRQTNGACRPGGTSHTNVPSWVAIATRYPPGTGTTRTTDGLVGLSDSIAPGFPASVVRPGRALGACGRTGIDGPNATGSAGSPRRT